MEQQQQHEHDLPLPITVEIVPEDPHDVDVAVIGEIGRHLFADLTREGYQVKPVSPEPGQRGLLDVVYEVMRTASVYAGDVWQHKDILDTASSIYTMFVAASPIVRYFLHGKEQQTTSLRYQKSDPEIKVSITIDGAKIELTSHDLETDERVHQLAERFIAEHPSLKATPRSKVGVKARVRSQKKRRRY